MILRKYQAGIIEVAKTLGDVAVVSPTGSGKTTVAVTMLALSMARGEMSHAIITAPQGHIENGFLACNDREIRWPRGKQSRPGFKIPDGFVRAVRDGRGTLARQIIDYLNTPSPGYAFACTHAAMTTLMRNHGADVFPVSLLNCSLLVDEAHHASAEGLGEVVDAWEARGGRLLYFTATPHRGDGKKVIREGMTKLERSLAEHMASGYAPRNLANELVPFGAKGDKVTGAQFTGEAVSQDKKLQAGLVRKIVAKWEEDGRPKAIIRVPPMAGGSGPLIAVLVAKLRKAGARVMDATGLGKERQKQFLAMLDTERAVSHEESSWDVVVGSQRVVEGTDWPVCSTVYCVGIPMAINTVVQLLGRSTRPKDDGHPQRDTAKIVFFVPSAGGDALDRLSFEHSKHALMTCVFLADHEVGERWIVASEVRKGLGSEPIDVSSPGADPDINLATYAEIKLHMTARLEENPTATIDELMDATREAMPWVSEADLTYLAIHLLAAEKPKVRKKIRDKARQRAALPPDIREDMREVFEEIVREFRDAQLTGANSLKSLLGQTHTITGGGIRTIADRFRDARGTPLTEEMIVAWVNKWLDRTGDKPKASSGEIPGSNGERWSSVDRSLNRGIRGLPGRSSLARFISEHFGHRNQGDLPRLTAVLIVAWIKEWHKHTGSYPNKHSGEIPKADGETWINIDSALRGGHRGLPGGSSLSKFLAEHFGRRYRWKSQHFIAKQIITWIKRWHEKTGFYPNRDSGGIPETDGETWVNVDSAFRKGYRGLPGGSSLAKFIAEHFDFRSRRDAPRLNKEQIITWIEEYRIRVGMYPNRSSGLIPESGGETWQKVNAALVKGTRGLSGESSLPKFIAKHFPESHRSRQRTTKPHASSREVA